MNQKTKANGPRTTKSTFISEMSSALILWMPNTRTPRKRNGENSRKTAHTAMPQRNLNGAARNRISLVGGFITLRWGRGYAYSVWELPPLTGWCFGVFFWAVVVSQSDCNLVL